MYQSIPIPPGADITQYNHIQCVRPADGLIIRAQRVIINELTPVNWTMAVEGRSEQWRDLGWTVKGTRETYSTSELIEFAENAGFGEWQQSVVDVRVSSVAELPRRSATRISSTTDKPK